MRRLLSFLTHEVSVCDSRPQYLRTEFGFHP